MPFCVSNGRDGSGAACTARPRGDAARTVRAWGVEGPAANGAGGEQGGSLVAKVFDKEHPPVVLGASLSDSCSICLEGMMRGEKVSHLPCMHSFHHGCISPWLQRNFSCPLCKQRVM